MQVQDRPGDICPRREVGRRDVLGQRCSRRRPGTSGPRPGRRQYSFCCSIEQCRQHLDLVRPGGTGDRAGERPVNAVDGVPPPCLDDLLGERPRRLDVRWIVQQNQRLLRNVGRDSLANRLFVRRRIKRQQARMQEAPLPPRIKPAAVLARVRDPPGRCALESSAHPSIRMADKASRSARPCCPREAR